MASKRIEVQILGDAASLKRALVESSGSLDKFGHRTSLAQKAVGGFKVAGLAAIPVVGLLAYQLKGAVEAAAAAQNENAILAHTMHNLKIAGGGVVQSVKESNAAFGAQYGFLESQVTPAFTQLVRSTGDVKEANRLMAVSADLARGKNLDLSATAVLLSKVWQGNFTSLKRLGLEVPKVTTAQDKLAATNKKATTQQTAQAKATDMLATRQAVLNSLTKHFGGDAAKSAKTGEGAINRLNAAYNQVMITIGTALLPSLVQLANKFSTWLARAQKTGQISRLVKRVDGDIQTLTSDVGSLASAFNTAAHDLGPFISAFEHINSLLSGTGGLLASILPGAGLVQQAYSHGGGTVGATQFHHGTGSGTSTPSSGHGHRAMGGPVLPHQAYTVGERGPETLVMGSTGGMITPHGGGHPMQVNLVLDRRVVASVLVDADKTHRRQNGGRSLFAI